MVPALRECLDSLAAGRDRRGGHPRRLPSRSGSLGLLGWPQAQARTALRGIDNCAWVTLRGAEPEVGCGWRATTSAGPDTTPRDGLVDL